MLQRPVERAPNDALGDFVEAEEEEEGKEEGEEGSERWDAGSIGEPVRERPVARDPFGGGSDAECDEDAPSRRAPGPIEPAPAADQRRVAVTVNVVQRPAPVNVAQRSEPVAKRRGFPWAGPILVLVGFALAAALAAVSRGGASEYARLEERVARRDGVRRRTRGQLRREAGAQDRALPCHRVRRPAPRPRGARAAVGGGGRRLPPRARRGDRPARARYPARQREPDAVRRRRAPRPRGARVLPVVHSSRGGGSWSRSARTSASGRFTSNSQSHSGSSSADACPACPPGPRRKARKVGRLVELLGRGSPERSTGAPRCPACRRVTPALTGSWPGRGHAGRSSRE